MTPATHPRRPAPPAARRSRFARWRSCRVDALPCRLGHRRIYILPTGRGLAFLWTLLLMLVASINYALGLGYALCFLLTGLSCASLLGCYRNLAGLIVEGIETRPVFAGDALAFTLQLRAPPGATRVGIDLSVASIAFRDGERRAAGGRIAHDRVDVPTAGSIATLHVADAVRGSAVPGRVTLGSDFPLGLWTAWAYLHHDSRALVYPRPEAGAPVAPEQPAPATGPDDEMPGELRDYRDGDRPASIAWTRAAGPGSLQVRECAPDPVPAVLVLRLEDAGAGDIEQRLSRLAAWARRATLDRRPCALELPGLTIAAATGLRHEHRVLGALARYGEP